MTISDDEIEQYRQRLYDAYDAYYTRLVENFHVERDKRWQRDFTSLDAYLQSVEPNRQRWREFLSWHVTQTVSLRDATQTDSLRYTVERLGETEHYTIDRVFLSTLDDIAPDGLLLRPHGDGQRPAVIAQHGLGSAPEHVCGLNATQFNYYKDFGKSLAERGYVVFAPRMVTTWQARQRLHRKAMLMGVNIMGVEMFGLSRVVDYLQTLDFVLPDRIGMYGLSQGGMSTLWFAAADTRIAAAVCSAFFNHRWQKMIVSGGDHYTAYIDSPEEDKFFFGQLLEFSDSDLASLICPRPFMVEAGVHDRAAPADMQEKEFAIVKAIYEKLGIGDRAQIHVHDGGHEIVGTESFTFLDRWLKR